jgi:hypothetical protein
MSIPQLRDYFFIPVNYVTHCKYFVTVQGLIGLNLAY